MKEKTIEQVISSLTLTKQQLVGVAERFVEGKGLANLPSYIYVDRQPREGEFIVLEMGGTYLRAAKVKLEVRNGKLKVKYLSEILKGKIPCREKECHINCFFEQIVEQITPVLSKNANIGFVFSYAIKITPDVDGILLRWTKEIRVPQLVGKLIGRELKKVLQNVGYGGCRVVVLNDAVATLISGLTIDKSSSSLAGLVVGTGMNLVFVRSGMVCNPESANLDISGLGIRTPFDKNVDGQSFNPGVNSFEKLLSGMYLPRVFNEIVGEGQVVSADDMTKVSGAEGKIAEALFRRSAQLIGAVVAGAVSLYSTKKISVVTEGSVFWKVTGYKTIVEETVRNLVDRELEVEFIKVDNPGLVGAAIAAALVS